MTPPAANLPSKLVITDLSKRFAMPRGEEIVAISGVSFEVKENEVCVILGPSGCGKSTVLRMIAGLEKPSSGSLLLDGRSIDRPGRDRGMVFQAYTSFDWLTVRQNVEYGMRINGIGAKERRSKADHFIDLVQLTQFADVYPSRLSGGMKQRVAIARTLANDPELLLMDEPFGALDAETRWHMQELLIEIAKNTSTTIIMITHDLEEAIFVADKIVFMSRHPGRVHQIIVPEFKGTARIADKEAVIAKHGYAEMEREIMHLMRQQGQH